MIKNTHKKVPDFTVSAYSDNAAVLQGDLSNFWAPDYSTGTWKLTNEVLHPLIKVETHNHPTAISPFPGAATGSGGEIRVCISCLRSKLVAFPYDHIELEARNSPT